MKIKSPDFVIFVQMIEKLMDNRIKYGYFILSVIIFIIMVLRNAWVPFNHDEMATFVMYVQNGEFWPYHSIVDANNHILNSGLSHICFKLFGDSLFALRLPNLGAYVIMVIAVYRLLYHLKTKTAKIVLISFFLLAFNWISFFNICRGYGISMSLLMVSFVFVLEYFRSHKRWLFYGFLLFIQLAISANLTLLVIALMLSALVVIYQLSNKILFDLKLLPGYIMHIVSLYLWIGFSFFLQEGNALYYGQGESYWEVTFVTVIELLSGWINYKADILIAGLMLLALFTSGYLIIKESPGEKIRRMQPLLIFTLLFCGLMVAFYVLHIWKGVNFPEDRTGLFFYPVGVMMIVFLADGIRPDTIRRFFLILPAALLIQFFLLLNFKNHPMNEYETFPERFYTTLLEEQESSKDKITISGHRLNELMFAYFNYTHGGNLNPVDDSEVFNVYSDYGITKTDDADRYLKYYDVIDKADWNFVLLKRKNKCKRISYPLPFNSEWKEGTNEFTEFFRFSGPIDPAWKNKQIAINMNFTVDHASQPFNGWLVFEIRNKNEEVILYKRAALNWIKFTWNGINNYGLLFMGNKPTEDPVSMVVYLWNNKKQFIRIKMNDLKLLVLEE